MDAVPAARLHRAVPWLLLAQFSAGLADHALLIVALGVLVAQGQGFWWAPLLKIGFTASYVVLAPWVGAWVDAGCKARWMIRTHCIKAGAVSALLLGAPALLCFVAVGCAAAIYSPARYGWVTEVTQEQSLVKANAWLEVALVGSALMGTVLGGLLLSPGWRHLIQSITGSTDLRALTWLSGASPEQVAALIVLVLCYVLAALINRQVPRSGWILPTQTANVRTPSLASFVRDNRTLWSDLTGGQVSLAATSLFWGVGAALQMIVLQWASTRLALPLHQAAYLQGVIAVGMVVGAVLAGRWVKIRHALRLLPVGVALGVLVPIASLTTHFGVAALCLALAAAAAGFTVIPLNALLQSRGVQLLTPGRSIAVQAFNENASILLMLGLYALLARLQVSPVTVMWLLGATVSAGLLLLMRWARKTGKRQSICAATGKLIAID